MLTDAHIVIVGMNPVVTMTILEIGLELNFVETAPNLEMGLEMLDNRFDKLF